MARLPAPLMPWWPVVKRAHLATTRFSGAGWRLVPGDGPRSLPRNGSVSSEQTALAEPEHVTVTVAGAPEHLVRPRPVGSPAPLRFWDEVLDRTTPARGVVEVRHGRLVGDVGALVTPGGLLDLETSPYFGIRGWEEHPLFLRPRLPAVSRTTGTTLSLVSPASGSNYYHSVMDALPRWGMARELDPNLVPDHVVMSTTSPWARELARLIGLDPDTTVEPRRDVTVLADRLLVPSLTNQRTLAPRWTTDWLRRSLPPRSGGHDLPRRLYVTRGSRPNSRRVVDEAALLERLRPLGFHVVDPGTMSVQDQIDHFSAAEVVVGPHGAALTNLVFAPDDVRVLELFAPRYLNPGFWSVVANLEAATYRYLVADTIDPDRPEHRMTGVQDDVAIPVDRVVAAVEELMS